MKRAIEILLVEDSPEDVELTKIALKRAEVLNNLHVVNDGVKCLEFLNKENGFNEVPTPDIILLDLNMPKMDGREVLSEIKSDPNLRVIPVIILSTSRAPRDITESYSQHANSYVAKPINFDEFNEIVKHLENFWFKVAVLPTEN